MIIAGVVSASALVNGFVGYLNEFVQLDRVVIIPVICIVSGGFVIKAITDVLFG